MVLTSINLSEEYHKKAKSEGLVLRECLEAGIDLLENAREYRKVLDCTNPNFIKDYCFIQLNNHLNKYSYLDFIKLIIKKEEFLKENIKKLQKELIEMNEKYFYILEKYKINEEELIREVEDKKSSENNEVNDILHSKPMDKTDK